MPHGNVRRSGRGRLPAERSMCLASARTGLAGGKPKMNTTPGNHRVGQEIRMGHVGAALRSTSWRPTGPHDVTELPALRRIQIHVCVRVRLASLYIWFDMLLLHIIVHTEGGQFGLARPQRAGRAAKRRPYRAHAHLQAFSARPAFGQLGMISRTTLNTYRAQPRRTCPKNRPHLSAGQTLLARLRLDFRTVTGYNNDTWHVACCQRCANAR